MSRDKNRLDMPVCAKMIDDLTAAFGPVRVTFVSENGITRGKRDERKYFTHTSIKLTNKKDSGRLPE